MAAVLAPERAAWLALALASETLMAAVLAPERAAWPALALASVREPTALALAQAVWAELALALEPAVEAATPLEAPQLAAAGQAPAAESESGRLAAQAPAAVPLLVSESPRSAEARRPA